MALTANILFVCGQKSLTVKMHGMEGWIGGLQDQGDRYRRTGGTGTGTQSTGSMARADTHPAWVACATKDDAATLVAHLEAMQNYTCRVTDQHGRTLERVRLNTVTITMFKKTKGPPISATVRATYRVEANLELELLPDD